MADENITEDEVWNDLDAQFALQERMPGDIDVTQIADRYKVHVNTAWNYMVKMVNSGEYIFVTVSDDVAGNRKRKIIRKVK